MAEQATPGSSLGGVAQMSVLFDRFMPSPDVGERHTTLVRPPVRLVLEVARDFDLQDLGVLSISRF